MKYFILLLFTTLTLFSEQIQIEATSLVSDDANGITTLTGNVVITRGEDIMKAEEVIVFLNKDRDIERFEADGNTSFILNFKDNQKFLGKADSFNYFPIAQQFTLKGSAEVEDVINNRKLIGNEIIFDEKSQTASIKGKVKEPVKVIFNIADKNESSK